jgi:hypothetical protein
MKRESGKDNKIAEKKRVKDGMVCSDCLAGD